RLQGDWSSDVCSSDLLWSPSELDLDVHAGRQVETHQGIDHFRVRVEDVDDPLVGAHLELFTRVLVDERRTDHRLAVDLGRQRDRSEERRVGKEGVTWG